jgi:crotonobetainyl-CoA:carnitine CoA-transferase CaiB-like acyl-CoA transferase
VELRDVVVPQVAALVKSLPTSEWEQRLIAANVPHAVVRDYADIFNSEQTAARGMKLTVRDPAGNPIELVGNPFHIAGTKTYMPASPPSLGEQTDEVLGELGLTADEVSRLRQNGVI